MCVPESDSLPKRSVRAYRDLARRNRRFGHRYVDVEHIHWSFMTAKRLDHRAILGALALTIVASAAADAQMRGGVWTLSPNTGRGRPAVQAQPQPTVVVARPVTFLPPQPVAFIFVPAVLMSDGSVYANFGYGYEPIVRPCANNAVVTQTGVLSTNGTVIYQPAPPTYQHPAPNPVTSAYVRSGQTSVVVTTGQNAQLACFSRDATGRVFAYRY